MTVGWGITNVNTLPPKFSSILQKTSLTDKTFCYHYEDDEDEVYHLIYGIGEQTSVCKGKLIHALAEFMLSRLDFGNLKN